MNPYGVNNYCCGGGSGFAIMTGSNMRDRKLGMAGRMKVKQALDLFQDVIGPEIVKYSRPHALTARRSPETL